MLRALRVSLRAPFRTLAAVALVAGIAAACAPFPPAEPGGPALTVVNDWVSGRSKIWDLAFPAGGQPPLYTENDSGVIFARMNGSERARPLGGVTQFDANFDPTGEGGLMGIALSPGFDGATNRRAFVCYSTTSDNRVARFDVNYAAGAFVALSNWTPIVTGLPHSSFHNGCRVRFQPGTGALFVSTGDATTATGPQSTTVLAGKILRIDQDGNPWPGQRLRRSLVHARAPQPTRAGVPTGIERPVLRRARPRRQRRGQQARERRQLRVEPQQRLGRVRPVEADDRRVDRTRQHDDTGVAVGWGDGRAVGRHVPLGCASGRTGTARSSSRASTAVPTSASVCW